MASHNPCNMASVPNAIRAQDWSRSAAELTFSARSSTFEAMMPELLTSIYPSQFYTVCRLPGWPAM